MPAAPTDADKADGEALPAGEKRTRIKRAYRKSHKEGPTRVLMDWTPALRRAAIASADSGNLRLAADLCETMMADDRVSGCVGTRVRGLMGLPLNFKESGTRAKGKGQQAAKALEASEDFWAAFPEATLTQFYTWAFMLGVALGELTWKERAGRIVPTLKVWHPRNLKFDWVSRAWFLNTEEGEIQIEPGDGKWVLCTPYGAERPWSLGAWKSLSLAWMAKHFTVHDWARHNEVHGSPMIVGTSPEGSDEDDWDQWAADLGDLGGRTAMAAPPGYGVSLVEAKSRSFESFLRQVEWADKAIAIVLLGQNLTTDVTGGSFAAATVHNQIRYDVIRFDAESLSTTLHDQVLVWWAEFNFADAQLAPWPSWDTTPPEDVKAAATSLQMLGQALLTLSQAKVPLDVKALAERFNIPLIPGAKVWNPADIETDPNTGKVPKVADPAPSDGQEPGGDAEQKKGG